MCGRLLQCGVRFPYANHTFALQIGSLRQGWGEGSGAVRLLEPSWGHLCARPPDFRPSAPSEWPAMTSGWQHAAAWLFNPSPERALATCPSPWQIKPQTEGKQDWLQEAVHV